MSRGRRTVHHLRARWKREDAAASPRGLWKRAHRLTRYEGSASQHVDYQHTRADLLARIKRLGLMCHPDSTYLDTMRIGLEMVAWYRSTRSKSAW